GTYTYAVAKSLHKFVNYGKRKKESVAELLVILSSYCWVRSYGQKDYVQVEDFTDQSQSDARVAGETEVKHIYKCIQRTSEYISALMDDFVEIPTLKIQLFGRATPFQDGSETRNTIEDGNTTFLPCRDIKNPERSKERQKGIQLAIPCKPITTKIKWSIKGWEGLTSKIYGQSKGKCPTEGWEGVCSASWGHPNEDGGPPDFLGSNGKWTIKGWGKVSLANWGQ
ncbi:hypothetical protein MTR67_030853, partial [Solanum verrucosum]